MQKNLKVTFISRFCLFSKPMGNSGSPIRISTNLINKEHLLILINFLFEKIS